MTQPPTEEEKKLFYSVQNVSEKQTTEINQYQYMEIQQHDEPSLSLEETIITALRHINGVIKCLHNIKVQQGGWEKTASFLETLTNFLSGHKLTISLEEIMTAVMKEWHDNRFGECLSYCQFVSRYLETHGSGCIDSEKWKQTYKNEK